MIVGLQNEPDVREKQNSGAGEHLLGAAGLGKFCIFSYYFFSIFVLTIN